MAVRALEGVHHVTAITSDIQSNVDFYTGTLGLRLVKKTVNFDDPGSYHIYYGDRVGTPGTLVTFFEYPGARQARAGAGEPVALAYEIPVGSAEWWRNRLNGQQTERFGAKVIRAADPDGMAVELVETADMRKTVFWEGGVPLECALGAIQSITLSLANVDRSAPVYRDGLSFTEAGSEGERRRFRVGESLVDVVPSGSARGVGGGGTIHHVAFRTESDRTQGEWLGHVAELGLHSSPVMERDYFRSIYFREPGGVLFEIATDGPGMLIDEPEEHLGEALSLPEQHQPLRAMLERSLTPIKTANLVRS